MRNIQKPLGILVFLALCMTGSVLVTEAKTKRVFAQDLTQMSIQENLHPTKWEAINMLGRGTLSKGVVIDATYTEEELNGFIEGILASKNISWFIDNASVTLKDDVIEFTGRLLRPIKGNLVVEASISIEQNEPVISIHSARYGIFRTPASFVERVGDFVLKKKTMNDWLHVENAQWKDFSIRDGSVHIQVVGE